MAVTGDWFANAKDQAFSGNINWASDTIKMALLTSSATPNLNTWVHFSDLTNEVSGTGYTAGGVTLGSKSHAVTAANSWATTWAGTTAFAAGAIIRPSTGNGFLYRTPNGGTSAGSAPSFPTIVDETVTEAGGLIWTNLGSAITVWSSANAVWTTATFSAQYGVIYDAQTGTGSTEPLIALINLGGSSSVTSGTFTIQPDPTLGWVIDLAS